MEVGDGIARVYGLSKAMSGELLKFENGVMGMALNLEEDNIGVVIFGESTGIKEGGPVKSTGKVAEVPSGEGLLLQELLQLFRYFLQFLPLLYLWTHQK